MTHQRACLIEVIRFLLSMLLATSAAGVRAQDNANLADFDFVVATVEANYSGWPTKTACTKGEAAPDPHAGR
jgi:hypothetical protein